MKPNYGKIFQEKVTERQGKYFCECVKIFLIDLLKTKIKKFKIKKPRQKCLNLLKKLLKILW